MGGGGRGGGKRVDCGGKEGRREGVGVLDWGMGRGGKKGVWVTVCRVSKTLTKTIDRPAC